MIRILVENNNDKISIIGLIELGCKACKEAMETGHGNPENCKICGKNKIEYYDKTK